MTYTIAYRPDVQPKIPEKYALIELAFSPGKKELVKTANEPDIALDGIPPECICASPPPGNIFDIRLEFENCELYPLSGDVGGPPRKCWEECWDPCPLGLVGSGKNSQKSYCNN